MVSYALKKSFKLLKSVYEFLACDKSNESP